MQIIAFCVITFEPIKIKTCSAPQNDRLNLSFVKYIHVDGEIWLEMVVKRLLVSLLTFETPSKSVTELSLGFQIRGCYQ